MHHTLLLGLPFLAQPADHGRAIPAVAVLSTGWSAAGRSNGSKPFLRADPAGMPGAVLQPREPRCALDEGQVISAA